MELMYLQFYINFIFFMSLLACHADSFTLYLVDATGKVNIKILLISNIFIYMYYIYHIFFLNI